MKKIDKKWNDFHQQFKPLSNEVEKTAENTSTALGLAAEELKAGYKRIRKLL